MNELEFRYRRLFAAYPPEFRELHEDEMISTLLDVARPGQQRPDSQEAAAIIWAGAQHRFRSANELNRGLQLAGAVATGLVCMLGLAAIRVTTLPPIDAYARTQLLGWALLAVALIAGWRSSWSHYRFIPPTAASVLLLIGGSEMMGMRRSFLIPVALLLMLSTLAATTTLRTRSLAAAAGAAGSAALFESFLDRSNNGFGPGEVPWELANRWELAQSIAKLPMWLYFALIAAALVGGLFLPRIAVAAAILAGPVVLLTTTRLQHLELYAGLAAAAVIVVVILAGAARTAIPRNRGRDPGVATRTSVRPG